MDERLLFLTMPRQGKSRDRLIAAGLQLMRERGYEAVGVEAICQKAGLNKGSFYHYFSTKTDLALAALENCWQDYQKAVLAPAFQSSIPPLERLAGFFTQCYRCHREARELSGHVCGCFFGSLGCELSAREDKIRSRVEGIMRGMAVYFEEALVEARSRGLIHIEDIPGVVQAILGCLEGAILLAKIYNNPDILRDVPQTIFKLIGAPVPNHSETAAFPVPENVNAHIDFLD